MDYKRRTNPSFLSKDEAARESRRTEAMVRGIIGSNQPRAHVKEKVVRPISPPSGTVNSEPSVSSVLTSQITRVGETSNFLVDYDDKDKLVALYGKEIPMEYPFKLRLSMNETVTLARLLGVALRIVRNNPRIIRIGERTSFVVECDGWRKRVMLYQGEKTTLCPFKLVFDEYEIIMIINILKKAKDFFWQ